MNPNYKIIAHTGCMGTEMNSIESIKAGIQAKADYIELDIRFSKDGPVLTHDSLRPDTCYLKLEDALNIIKPAANVNVALDLKEWERITEITDILKHFQMTDRAIYLGNFMDDIDLIRTFGGGVPCFPNLYPEQVNGKNKEDLNKLAENIRFSDAAAVGIDYTAASKLLSDILHENNILLSVWTVDDLPSIEKMLSYNVDFITSNRLDLLKNIPSLL